MHGMSSFFRWIEEAFSIAWLFSSRVCCTWCQLQPLADGYAVAFAAVGWKGIPPPKRVFVDTGDGLNDRTADHC